MAPTPLKSGSTPRIGVLTNPLSGKNRQRPEVLPDILRKYPEVLQQTIQTPGEIRDTLASFARCNVNLLVINGGDGTVQAVLTVLFHKTPFSTQPELMVLKGGTTNMIAGDIGVSGNQIQALQRLLHWAETGSGSATRIQRPILRLSVPGHGVKYGMFFGAAGISQGTQYYRKKLHHKKLHGFPGICLTIASFLWAVIRQHDHFAKPTPITIHLNRQPSEQGNYMLLFVSTLDHLFFGLRPFWGIEDETLRFTAVKSQARYLLRLLPFLARGRKTERGTPENGYTSHNVAEAALYLAGSVVLDGELYTPESSRQPTLLEKGGEATFLRI